MKKLAWVLFGVAAVCPVLAAAQVCTDSALVLHYDFATDEGVVVSDLSPAGHNGTVQGATWEGGAYRFDGANDFISAHSAPGLDDLSAFTYAAWINPTASGNREIMSKARSTHEMRHAGSRLRGCIIAGPNACSESLDGAIETDVWQHVAMTYDHGGDQRVHLYIDGVEVTYAVQSTGGGSMATDASSNLNIGRRSNARDRYFAGLIDDARIYDRALTVQEIAALPGCDSTTPFTSPPPRCSPLSKPVMRDRKLGAKAARTRPNEPKTLNGHAFLPQPPELARVRFRSPGLESAPSILSVTRPRNGPDMRKPPSYELPALWHGHCTSQHSS